MRQGRAGEVGRAGKGVGVGSLSDLGSALQEEEERWLYVLFCRIGFHTHIYMYVCVYICVYDLICVCVCMLFCVEGGGVGGGEGYMCYYFFLAMGQRSEAYGRRRKALVAILSKRTGDYEEEGDGCGLRAISSSAEGCNPLGAYATGDVCVCV